MFRICYKCLVNAVLFLIPVVSFAGVKIDWETVENRNLEVIIERHKVQDFVFKELLPSDAKKFPTELEQLHSEDWAVVTTNVETGFEGNDKAIPIWINFISQEHRISDDTSEILIPSIKSHAKDYSGISMKGEISNQGKTVFHTVSPDEVSKETKESLKLVFAKLMNMQPRISLDLEYGKPYVVKNALDEDFFGVMGMRGELVTTYTLNGTKDGVAQISYVSDIQIDLTITSEQSELGTDISPKATTKGEIFYDIQNRLVRVHKMTTLSEGVIPYASAKVDMKLIQTDIIRNKLLQ